MRPCPKCETDKNVKQEPNGPAWLTFCDGCYDCDCDENGFFTTSIQGFGWTREESADDWNEKVDEYEPPAWKRAGGDR